ncbi:MAG: hypothetical protein H6732_17305 [Alphaproteobacteria bacterium]|nr:hypothetical protein [Alphaproteobacteria bacterium]
MTLYDPTRPAEVDPADAVLVVHDFLTRVRTWCEEQEIPKRLARVAQSQAPADAASLHAWLTYLRFTEHALAELEDGTLDRWFGETRYGPGAPGGPT